MHNPYGFREVFLWFSFDHVLQISLLVVESTRIRGPRVSLDLTTTPARAIPQGYECWLFFGNHVTVFHVQDCIGEACRDAGTGSVGKNLYVSRLGWVSAKAAAAFAFASGMAAGKLRCLQSVICRELVWLCLGLRHCTQLPDC